MKSPLKLDEEEVKILQDFIDKPHQFQTGKTPIGRGRTRFPSEGQAHQHSDFVTRFGSPSKKSDTGRNALSNPHLKHPPQIRDGQIEKRRVMNYLKRFLP